MICSGRNGILHFAHIRHHFFHPHISFLHVKSGPYEIKLQMCGFTPLFLLSCFLHFVLASIFHLQGRLGNRKRFDLWAVELFMARNRRRRGRGNKTGGSVFHFHGIFPCQPPHLSSLRPQIHLSPHPFHDFYHHKGEKTVKTEPYSLQYNDDFFILRSSSFPLRIRVEVIDSFFLGPDCL